MSMVPTSGLSVDVPVLVMLMLSSVGESVLAGASLLRISDERFPPVERRDVAGVPGLAQPGGAQVPIRADLAGDRAQVVPEVDDRGAAPEPVAVVDAVDDEPGLEHERVRDHRVVLGVGVLLDVEVLLDDALGVREEWPLGADRGAELLQRVMLVGADRDDLGVGDGDLRIVGGELVVLLVLLGAVVAAREREDQGIVALQLAEPARDVLVIGQLVIGERGAGDDVGAHDGCLSWCDAQAQPERSCWPPSMSYVAPVSAVLAMMWTASPATSAGPTTRPIGSVARSSARRASS